MVYVAEAAYVRNDGRWNCNGSIPDSRTAPIKITRLTEVVRVREWLGKGSHER